MLADASVYTDLEVEEGLHFVTGTETGLKSSLLNMCVLILSFQATQRGRCLVGCHLLGRRWRMRMQLTR